MLPGKLCRRLPHCWSSIKCILNKSARNEGSAAYTSSNVLPLRQSTACSAKPRPVNSHEGIPVEEIASRRQTLMQELRSAAQQNEEILVLLPAASTSFSGPDIPYPFRQESNFFYLTGFNEKNAVLVMRSRNASHCESTLFVEPKNPQEELWEGPRAGLEGALECTGVENTALLPDLKPFLQDLCKVSTSRNLRIYYDPSKIDQSISALAKNLLPCNINSKFTVTSPYDHVHKLRWIKSKNEQRLLRTSCQIASSALSSTMRFSHSGVNENLLWAKMDFECRARGAKCLAYPPVVAGGPRANTIHYLNNDQPIEHDNLVLMDAGCEYFGYASDITRCWPVSGKFTQAQRLVYEVLYDVQTELILFCEQAGPTLNLRALYIQMLHLMGGGLEQLGVRSESASAATLADRFCPHHVSHYVGLDVHDTETVSKSIALKPGVVITVEPGLYFREDDEAVPEQFRGIGLRIEDDLLITETGVENLTKDCPSRVNDIEKACAK